MFQSTERISLLRALSILMLGVVTGIQIALYLYDHYEDGIADVRSLLIGIAMLLASIGFVLFSFRRGTSKSDS